MNENYKTRINESIEIIYKSIKECIDESKENIDFHNRRLNTNDNEYKKTDKRCVKMYNKNLKILCKIEKLYVEIKYESDKI